MRTIYKILIAFLAITMVASGVSAFDFQRDYGNEDVDFISSQPRPYSDTGIEYRDTITSAHGGIRLPTMGEVEEIIQPTQNGVEVTDWIVQEYEVTL